MKVKAKGARRVEIGALTALTMAGAAAGMLAAGAAQANSGWPAPDGLVWLADSSSESGEGGEGGEGGESGHTAAAGTSVGFLTNLALIEGHLRAGVALYKAGHADHATSHMKHPQDEIYTDLLPQLQAVGAEDFAAELQALSDAVAAGSAEEAVDAALAAVLKEIDEAREHSHAAEADEALAIAALVHQAGEEYGVGVVDGALADAHEYQDAWGFVQVARALADHMAGEDDEKEKAFGQAAQAALAALDPAFPGVMPDGVIAGDAGLVLSAAATIELAAYGLR